MFEYSIDLKNLPICVKELHDQCMCFKCREEKERGGAKDESSNGINEKQRERGRDSTCPTKDHSKD